MFVFFPRQVFKLELHRGWNSRLGFSLEPRCAADADGGGSVIRAIYADSVAARDGRLRVGDQMLMVSGFFFAFRGSPHRLGCIHCIIIAQRARAQQTFRNAIKIE